MSQDQPTPSTFRKRNSAEAARLNFWGVRGSIPAPGAHTVKFGGNTSCVELRADGQHIILDGGSGLRVLGLELMNEFGDRPMDLTILLTHTHWDHIQGFPFFVPAYDPKNKLKVLGYEGARRGLQATLEVQMESPYFPISFRDLPGHITIEELKEMEFKIGPIKVRAGRTKHPGITMGYRLETSAGSICFVPDHESSPGETWAEVADLIKDADLVLMDAQYTAEEYSKRMGWGHGCLDDVIRVACEAGVKRLYLFHHDPTHGDAFVEDMVARGRLLASEYDIDVDAAREGEHVILMPGGGLKRGG